MKATVIPAAAALALVAACGDQPTQPAGMAVAIDSVSPATSARGETVQLRILGAGFRNGAAASFERGGSAAADLIAGVTNFVSDRELIATLTIGEDAMPALYDVVVSNPDGARAAAGGIFTVEGDGPPIVVAAAQPSEAEQGEVREVRILGSGFRDGDEVTWERDGRVDDRVVIENTVFVSETELVVRIRIQPRALVANYDIVVNRPRKRGIGTEAFLVLPGRFAELRAAFSYSYSGYRSGSIVVDRTFVLDPRTMDPGSWGVTGYHYEYGEQFLTMHHYRDGLLDMMWCWVPGGKITGPGTRSLECWFTPKYDWETKEYPDTDYTSWVDGDRDGDGTGRITFTSVAPDRLVGTFSITMHAVDWEDWYNSPTIRIEDGTFDLPIVSSYYDRETGGDGGGPNPDTPTGSFADAINDHGVVVGSAYNAQGELRAVRWFVSADGSISVPDELDRLPGSTHQRASAINNAGVIVGTGFDRNPYTHNEVAFIHDGTTRALTPIPGTVTSTANDINDQGIVVGSAYLSATGEPADLRGPVWLNPLNAGELPLQLPKLATDARVAHGLSINNSGMVLGFSDGRFALWQIDEAGTFSAPQAFAPDEMVLQINDDADAVVVLRPNQKRVLMRGGEYIELRPLHGHVHAAASALNSPSAGEPVQVIGRSFPTIGGTGEGVRLVVWSVDASGAVAGPTDIGFPDGYTTGMVTAINSRGWIIGTVHTDNPNSMATLWRPRADGTGYDITTLGRLIQGQVTAGAVGAVGPPRCHKVPARMRRC